jgi:Domain of unknown function (DUF4157)
MKTHDSKTSTNHSSAPQKPFFSASPEHAFFSTERAAPTPFFQPQAVSPPTIQAKSGDVSEEEVQRMPAFDSEVTSNGEVQRKLINSPQHSSALPIQAKLTIGEPGDKYEQEADRVASQVVEQINAPAPAQSTQGQTVQRQEENKEELQAKPEITALQRMEESQEELQAKSNLQQGEAIGGAEASTDLTSAINSAKGGGQPLDTGLQRSIGQAMGADFSGVRVHTDTQADQLNRSIQAKAFTTGQDVFFRQGAYEPGSQGGQKLIAHELTHVVQQKGKRGLIMGQYDLTSRESQTRRDDGNNYIVECIEYKRESREENSRYESRLYRETANQTRELYMTYTTITSQLLENPTVSYEDYWYKSGLRPALSDFLTKWIQELHRKYVSSRFLFMPYKVYDYGPENLPRRGGPEIGTHRPPEGFRHV